ncbi:MAG: dihydroxyacetone kinase subunit L [Chloroflexales bacterium]|nr:dihydroxyacetone kinase subunit L [Chloroflexales bacterium]
MPVTTATLLNWLRHAAALIHEQREYLTELDAAIGDADHGANLDRGFSAVVEALPVNPEADAGAVLKSAGMRLISTVGGASGPLYGTAFRRAGKLIEGYHALSSHDLLAVLRAFLEAITAMGKAEPGDKTMVDALSPAVAALEQALAAEIALDEALRRAADAAHAGALATVPLVAHRGRASYLGERSAGHQDPGATSAALIVRALADVV